MIVFMSICIKTDVTGLKETVWSPPLGRPLRRPPDGLKPPARPPGGGGGRGGPPGRGPKGPKTALGGRQGGGQ